MSNKIFGYTVVSDPDSLTAFIASTRKEYQALEEAIKPVDAIIEELRKDWDPRSATFWQSVLKTHIPAIRDAAAACLRLFSQERTHNDAPVPLIISTTGIAYRCDLHSVEAQIEEAGILLTVFWQSRGSNSIEKQVRERQRLLSALRELSKATHGAIDSAHAELDKAPKKQAKLVASMNRFASTKSRLHVIETSPDELEGDLCDE